MGTEHAPVCQQHAVEVRMSLRTLHSDVSAPQQVLAAYACPECGSERRLPMSTEDARKGPDTGGTA
jgi:hypothetical protein